MSSNTGVIKVTLKMKDDGTIQVLKATGAESDKTGKKGKKAFKDMDKSAKSFTQSTKGASSAMMKMAGAAVGILGLAAAWNKLKSATKEYIALANTQEEAETDLEAVLRSTGNAAGYNITQLKTMASAMQDITRTGDEVILGGMSILATFKQIRGEAFERASMAALDMSRIMKQDLKSSMVQLGKALNDPITGLTALSRVGVTFSEDQKTVIKALQETGDIAGAQAIILAELESQFGGAASAAAETFAGRMEQASNALGDTKEEMGYVITKNKFFIEIAKMATQEFKRWGKHISDNRDHLMDLAKNGVVTLVKGLRMGIEALRFFHNGWLGIKLVGNTAVAGLALALNKLYPILRGVLAPLDAIFEGAKSFGLINVNPFDKLEAGLAVFKDSSKEVVNDVLADIKSTNDGYDTVHKKLQEWEDQLKKIPASHQKANEQIKATNKSTYDEMAALAAKYAEKGNEKDRLKANQDFLKAFKQATMTEFNFERDQLKARYDEYAKYVTDKAALDVWYQLESQKITEKETQARLDAEKKLKDANKTTFQRMAEAAKNWSGSLASQLNDLIWQADTTFGDILTSFGKMLTEMIIQKQVAEPLMNFTSSGIESVGSWIGSFFHKGGIVGSGEGKAAAVPSIIYQTAPRYHTGLMPDEFPAVLKRGEGVFTPEQMKALGNLGGSPVNIRVEVENQMGDTARVTVREPQVINKQTILGITIQAMKTNEGGYREAIQAAARSV